MEQRADLAPPEALGRHKVDEQGTDEDQEKHRGSLPEPENRQQWLVKGLRASLLILAHVCPLLIDLVLTQGFGWCQICSSFPLLLYCRTSRVSRCWSGAGSRGGAATRGLWMPMLASE
jgi:hypothetical protein